MSQDFLAQIKEKFHCKEQDLATYSPLTLAYIGDAVLELVIRSVVVERANKPVNDLHKMTVKYVNAATQSAMITALMEKLSEEELAVYKRGRNAKSYSKAKNASLSDYRRATGFEALMGYLYLSGNTERMLELLTEGLAAVNLEL